MRSTPAARGLSLILAGAILGAVFAGAAGSLEASGRILADESLKDNRIDALLYLLWGLATGAAAGAILGGVAGAILGPTRGVAAVALWPVVSLASGYLLARLMETWLGRVPAAWIGLVAGIAAGTAAVIALSHVIRSEHPFFRAAAAASLVALLVPLLLAAWLGGRLALDRRQPPSGAPSLLLITIDTLRADAVSAFRDGRPLPSGLARARTPRLDALAAQGHLFMEASTPIPKTPQAVASLMTGTYPTTHRVRDLFSRFDESNLTLAEILRDAGWRTRAVVTNRLIGQRSGMAQGFDRFRGRDGLRTAVKELAVVDLAARLRSDAVTFMLNRFPSLRIGHEDAQETTDRAIEMMREAARPYFLWVHYLDPHWSYWPPESYRAQVDTQPGRPFTLYDDVRQGRPPIGAMIHDNRMTAAEVERVNALYAGEVNYMDHEVGRLIDAARETEEAGSTLVAFTSDHGESLGEHDYFFSHGDQVYEPSMRVPLIIRPAGGGAGSRIAAPVSLVDLLPTFLETMGATIPQGIEGISLVPLMSAPVSQESAGRPARYLFGESDLSYLAEDPLLTIPGEAGKIRSVRAGPFKLIRIPRDVEAARRLDPTLGAANAGLRNAFGFGEATRLQPSSPDIMELYDLATDPGETRDLSASQPQRAASMGQALDVWLAASLGAARSGRSPTEELLKTLESLGYVDPGETKP